MTKKAGFGKGLAAASILAVFISGCGDPPPPPKRADNEIRSGQNSMESGDTFYRKGDYNSAMSSYNSALASINEGRKFAVNTDKTTLDNMYKDVQDKIADAEAAQMRAKSEPPKVKPVSDQSKKDDEKAAKEKAAKEKAEAAEKKKADDEAKELAKLANAGKDSKGGKVEEAPATTAAAADASKAKPDAAKDPKAAAADAEGEEKKAAAEAATAILKAKEPYPAVTEKSPEIEVIKIGYSGTKYVYAYIQLYNKDENGKTINKVAAYFKDKDNQTIIPDNSAYTFPFEAFRPNAKDMIGDQNGDALTLGSAKIDGNSAKRYVVIGEGDRAKDVKKVAVKVMYDDGKAPWVQFPDK
jgi:hypothetical protein